MIQVHAEDFQFGLLGGVVTTGAEVPAPSASTPYFSSDTHRQLINIGGIGTGIRHQFPYASDEFRWQYDSSGLRWTTNASNSSNTFVMRLFNRNTGQTLMRVVMVQGSQSTTKAQYWNGAAWTDFPMGGTANILEAAGQKRWTFDIKLDNADGWMRWYAGGVLIDQLVGDTIFTATTDLTDGEVWGHGQNLGSIHYHTNFVWTDTADPRDFQIVVRAPTADGAENTMASGTYADVDDNVYAAGDSTYGEVGDRHLMVYEDLPASVTGRITTVLPSYAAARGTDAGTPTNMQHVTRIGGVNYNTASKSLPTTVTESMQYELPTNPATGTVWTSAAFNGAEFGNEYAA
jgi:hypothetical protein